MVASPTAGGRATEHNARNAKVRKEVHSLSLSHSGEAAAGPTRSPGSAPRAQTTCRNGSSHARSRQGCGCA